MAKVGNLISINLEIISEPTHNKSSNSGEAVLKKAINLFMAIN